MQQRHTAIFRLIFQTYMSAQATARVLFNVNGKVLLEVVQSTS
jgi:hypothetical protein